MRALSKIKGCIRTCPPQIEYVLSLEDHNENQIARSYYYFNITIIWYQLMELL